MKKYQILLCILFSTLLVSCGRAEDVSPIVSEEEIINNSDVEELVILSIGSISGLQDILATIDDEQAAELSDSKALADAAGNKVKEYANSGSYDDIIALLDILAGQNIKKVLVGKRVGSP